MRLPHSFYDTATSGIWGSRFASGRAAAAGRLEPAAGWTVPRANNFYESGRGPPRIARGGSREAAHVDLCNVDQAANPG